MFTDAVSKYYRPSATSHTHVGVENQALKYF